MHVRQLLILASFLTEAALTSAIGCGPAKASVVPVSGPDGRGGWLEINCPEDRRACRKIAANECPNGYDIADLRDLEGSRYMATSEMDQQIGPPGANGQLIVACKN